MSKQQLNTLLVDDDDQTYATTRNILAQLHHWQIKVEQASTYEDALTKLAQDTYYDLCLVSCCLGQDKGLDFLHRTARKNGKTPPFILLTDPNDHQTGLKALEAGAADYLFSDQIDTPHLERTIRHALETQRLKQELDRHKQQEELLKSSQQQYRDFFDIDIYGVEVLDATGKLIDCNAMFQELLGRKRDQLIGQHITTFTSDLSSKAFAKTMADLEEKGYAEGEREFVRPDNTTLLVWSRSRATYHEDGNINAIITFSRDITERMKAVKQISTLARALEQSPTALIITDTHGDVEYANFEFTELTGYAYEDVVGVNLRTLNLGQLSPENYQDFLDALAQGDEWQGELQGARNDGDPYWSTVTVAPMYDSNGALTHFIIMHEDITARKAEESEALRSQRRIGDLMTEQIGDLTVANEALQHEIEERIQAEEALEKIKARLEAQYKGIPIPTYTWEIIDGDFVLVDFNYAAEEESGGRIAGFLNKSASDVFKNRPQVLGDFLRCSIEKATVVREAPYKKVTTGKTRHYVTTYNFVEPNLILVYIQDITDFKKLEADWQKLRQAKDASAAADDTKLKQLQETLQQEIAQRQEAETALHEAEERMKTVADNIDERLREQYRSIPIPTYTWQMIAGEFILIDFNDAAAENMGRIVDFFGKPASEIFKDRPQILDQFQECYDEKRTVVYEAPYKMITTGESRYFVTTYNFVPPNLIVNHIQDITQQKAIEAELEQYRQQFGSLGDATQATTRGRAKEGTGVLIENNEDLEVAKAKYERAQETLSQHRARLKAQYTGIPIPTYTWQSVGGNDFILTDYNRAAESSTKGRIAAIMGRNASEVFNDRPEVMKDFIQCFQSKTIVRRESHYQLLTADATKFFVTTYNYVPPNIVIVYIEDITDHKLIEAKLRQGEAQVELKCRFSPQLALTFVNDAYCWYFDHSRQQLIGQTLPFVHDDDLQQVKVHLTSLRQDNPVGAIEYRVEKSNGDIRRQRWVNQAIFDHQGHLVEIHASGRDITMRKEG